jgi:hypothetical protein
MRAVLALATALAFGAGANAQMLHPGYGTVGAPMSNFISLEPPDAAARQ